MTPLAASHGKRAVQIAGFIVGLALLAYAVRLAISPDNLGVWQRLRDAAPTDVAALIGLTLLSLALNGVLFRITLAPVRKIPIAEGVGVNIIGTFLSLVPFKLSLVARTIIHRSRHGVPWPMLVSWFAVYAALTAGTLVIVGVGVYARLKWQLSMTACVVSVIAALVAFGAAACLAGKFASRERWNTRWSRDVGAMLRPPINVAAHLALRTLDIALFGARFAVAAKLTGVALGSVQSFMVGTMYLFLNAVAPAGTLGFTEAGTAGAAALLGMDQSRIVSLALICTACQAAVAGLLAVPSWLWLRPGGVIKAKERTSE